MNTIRYRIFIYVSHKMCNFLFDIIQCVTRTAFILNFVLCTTDRMVGILSFFLHIHMQYFADGSVKRNIWQLNLFILFTKYFRVLLLLRQGPFSACKLNRIEFVCYFRTSSTLALVNSNVIAVFVFVLFYSVISYSFPICCAVNVVP